MADDLGDSANISAGVDPVAIHASLSGASEEARVYLREQAELARLQKQNLLEQNRFELSHLRFRRLADWGKAALEIGVGLILLLIVVALGAMIWSAYDSGGLVIEPFSVPPDLTARGLNSQTVAAKLLDRLLQMQAETTSQRAPQSVQNYWGQDIKVMIPDTGISLGELDRFLNLRLGHATYVSGEIVRAAAGIAITARSGTDGSATVSGNESNLDPLMQRVAEQVYRLTQPYLYGAWLQARNRTGEALPIFVALATKGPAQERGWGYLGWSNCVEETAGEEARLPMLQRGVAADPHLFILRQNIALSEDALSRPQAANEDGAKALVLLAAPGHGGIRDTVAPFSRARMLSVIDSNTGDFHTAAARLVKDYSENHFAASIFSVRGVVARAFAGEHDLRNARAAMAMHYGENAINLSVRDMDDLAAAVVIAAQAEDWRAVSALGAKTRAILAKQPALHGLAAARIPPLAAYAQAKLGDLKDANALIAKSPDHCDLCLRARAEIAELQGEHARADWWFARAVAENPSIPFAYADWGEMLLREGDLDGAIAKFTIATQKGLHFADPLEMWGEALIAKNRSDLALAKFEEANKYAPNWGRLHLKWGEALWWSGNRDEAKKQFALARMLDLAAHEKSELAKVETKGRGAGP